MSAILFGSISTVADTSEVQRQAFNDAFKAHGLDWQWDQDSYRGMLAGSGGQSRISEYAESRGETVDAAAVHQTKSRLAQETLSASELAPRDGVVETIAAAKQAGWKVALVTTTSPDNISALLKALTPTVNAEDFDLVVDVTSVEQPKPDQASYAFALSSLGESAGDCVALEDNVGGVRAATGAGVACVAFPNENTAGQDFEGAVRTVDAADFTELRDLVHGA